jgi:hypothetical protein
MNWTCHHRKEKALGGTNEPRNLARVQDNRHKAWHILKGGMNLRQFCHFVNTYLIDPDYEIWLVEKHKPIPRGQMDIPLQW